MTTTVPDSPPDPRDEVRIFVNTAPPESRPPPLLSTGPVAWIRENLFSSLTDTLLTIVSVAVIVSVISGLLQWSIGAANWFVITFNLRQFLIGRYESEAEWRLQVLLLLLAVVIGVALAAWARFGWRLFAALLIVAVALLLLPGVVNSAISLPPALLAAGNVDIASGTVTETALPQLSFIAKAGEDVQLSFAGGAGETEAALAGLSGFTDRATNALRNFAANRLDAIERTAELDALLASERLTANQRETLTAEREQLEIPSPAIETYNVNGVPVEVRILDGATLEPLFEATLEPGGDPARYTLPADGWYVLEKTVPEGQEGAAVLRAFGIYPMFQRSFSRSVEAAGAEGGEEAPVVRVDQYIRMTDAYLTEAPRPTIDGEDVPFIVIIDNQYRGERPFDEFLRVYVSPFIGQINLTFALIVVLVIAGFYATKAIDRFFSPPKKPRLASNRVATWLLIITPVITFVLVFGVGDILLVTDTRNWGGLLLTLMLTMVGIIGAFPIGVLLALGRRSDLPVIRYASTLYIEFVRGVPLVTVLFMAQLLVPFLNPALADVDAVFRAMVAVTLFSAAYLAENVRGGLQSVPPGQIEAAKALGLSGLQVTLLITLPQALRAVIPALVGQFIGLFKDTSLVAIVGLIDLTGISNAVVAQTEFIGTRREAYLFIAIIYFVFSYVMSWVSRKIEETGSGVVRRG